MCRAGGQSSRRFNQVLTIRKLLERSWGCVWGMADTESEIGNGGGGGGDGGGGGGGGGGGCACPLHVDKCQQHYDDVTRLRIMSAGVERMLRYSSTYSRFWH